MEDSIDYKNLYECLYAAVSTQHIMSGGKDIRNILDLMQNRAELRRFFPMPVEWKGGSINPDNEVNTPIDKVYDVIVSEDLEALIFKVNLHLRKGGKLLGGLAIERHFNMQEGKEVATYAQTVMRE